MNIAKILKYCPTGTKLYSLLEGEVTLNNVNNAKRYPIEVINSNGDISTFTEKGLYYIDKLNGDCILFPSKEQRDWNKFRLPIKNGDVMMLPDGTCPFIATGKATLVNNTKSVKCHCRLNISGDLITDSKDDMWIRSFYIPATIKAKTELFDAMEREGISFDGEKLVKKTEEKSKSKKYKFKPFEKVLVRDRENDKWRCAFFSHIEEIDSRKFYACCSGTWNYIIPFEGNESLVGTISDPD